MKHILHQLQGKNEHQCLGVYKNLAEHLGTYLPDSAIEKFKAGDYEYKANSLYHMAILGGLDADATPSCEELHAGECGVCIGEVFISC